MIFFFASAAAGAAYLTVSETFPARDSRAGDRDLLRDRYRKSAALPGQVAFGMLVESGSRGSVFLGYLLGAVLMVIAGIVEAIWGVAAERKSLESVATPLSVAAT